MPETLRWYHVVVFALFYAGGYLVGSALDDPLVSFCWPVDADNPARNAQYEGYTLQCDTPEKPPTGYSLESGI